MIGVELTFPGKQLVLDAMELGLLINCTHDTVLRFLPPYICDREGDRPRGFDPQARLQACRQAWRRRGLSGHIERWTERYQAGEQVFESPPPLVVEFAGNLAPGSALDLACGPGRNALYLAELGWRVTALDGSPVAIDLLRARAHQRIDARLVDLEAAGFEIAPETFDLVLSSYYLQRSLIPVMKSALRSGGLLIMIVLLPIRPPGHSHARLSRRAARVVRRLANLALSRGRAGKPGDRQAVAELVAQKPAKSDLRWERGRGGALDGTGPRGWIRVASQQVTKSSSLSTRKLRVSS